MMRKLKIFCAVLGSVLLAFCFAGCVDRDGNGENTVAVTEVQIKTSLPLTLGVTPSEKLIPTVLPAEATDKAVTWSSDKPNIAEVSADGTVTAKAVGTAVITVTTVDGGKTATCNVTVKPQPIPTESVTLNKTTLTLAVDEEETLEATLNPAGATDTVSWSSDHTTIASVTADGTVRGFRTARWSSRRRRAVKPRLVR